MDALFYMHSKDIVHRDLKPSNILIRHPDDPSDIVIADFGFATYLGGNHEQIF